MFSSCDYSTGDQGKRWRRWGKDITRTERKRGSKEVKEKKWGDIYAPKYVVRPLDVKSGSR